MIAEDTKDVAARQSLLRAARDYERMARLRIEIGKADRDSVRELKEPEE